MSQSQGVSQSQGDPVRNPVCWRASNAGVSRRWPKSRSVAFAAIQEHRPTESRFAHLRLTPVTTFSCYRTSGLMTTYSYDRRASDGAQEHLENVMAMCSDAADEIAEELHRELSQDTDSGVLGTCAKLSETILDNLRIAGGAGAEKLSDVEACLKDVESDLVKLEAALKTAKRDANEEDDQTAIEAIGEATSSVRALKRELKSIEAEIADAPEDDDETQS